MRKQLLIVTISTLLCASHLFSQTYPGYRTGNYTGVNGAFFNPANLADNRFKWDINLAAINGFAGTDQGGIKFSDITHNFDANNLKTKILKGHSQLKDMLKTSNLARRQPIRKVLLMITAIPKPAKKIVDPIRSASTCLYNLTH